MQASAEFHRVALIGTGTIGAAWAAYLLSRGLEVVATDPAPEAEARLAERIRGMWPPLERLGLAEGADPARLVFAGTVEEAVEGADFVQESAPERADVKRALFERIDAVLPAHVPVASSASALLMTPLQRGLAHAGRFLLGHPFNPPHIMPLVEVSGGEETDPAVLDRAMAFYAAIGKVPVRLNRESSGHIAGRIWAAAWQEACSLVERGVASVEAVDKAVTFGPGLRQPILGPHLAMHVNGGEGGLAHFIAHLGASQEGRWAELGRPKLTPELTARLVAGVEAEAAGRSVAELERERDAGLVAVIEALRAHRGGRDD